MGPVIAVLAFVAAAPERIALAPLFIAQADAGAARQIEERLRVELARLPGIELVPEEATRAAAQAPCAADLGCLADLARALGVQKVVGGELRPLADSDALTLRLFDFDKGALVATVSASLNRAPDEMARAVRASATQLVAPDRFVGRLSVEAPEGATVTLNGVRAAREPLVLKPGTVGVSVRHAGEAAEGWVDVRFAQAATARVAPDKKSIAADYAPWEPTPAPLDAAAPVPLVEGKAKRPPPGWSFYAAVGGGAALAVAGLLELSHASTLSSELTGLVGVHGGIPLGSRDRAVDLNDRYASTRQLGRMLVGVGLTVGLGVVAYRFVLSNDRLMVGGEF